MDRKSNGVNTVTLNNGREMPMVGLGTFYGSKGNYSDDDVFLSVKSAISCGYRHIDCAWIYHNERCVGKAIRQSIEERVVTREELFITSKLSFLHHDIEGIRDVVNESLSDLGVKYLDLYLIHSPFAVHKVSKRGDPVTEATPLNQNNDHIAIWKVLESLVKDGLIRSIGLSNFNARQVQKILDNCDIKPVTNQCEIHLYLQNEKLRDYCMSRGVVMTAYTPLGKPLSGFGKTDWKIPLDETVVIDIAKKYFKTAAQIALKYQLQRGIVVIPKSSSPSRLKENIQLFDFELNEEDMKQLHGLERGMRAFTYDRFKLHKDFPLNDDF